jgi:hypothetical protein
MSRLWPSVYLVALDGELGHLVSVRGEGFGCPTDQINKLESGQSKSSPPRILGIMPL